MNGVDVFVAKYDWDGNLFWIRSFRPPSPGVAHLSMSVDSSGVYMAFTTYFDGSYLARYDARGNSVWLFRIPSTPYTISVGSGSVYVGGDIATTTGKNAALSEFGQSSSLIFFGLIPPFSFFVVSLLIAAAAISVLWLRKRARSNVRLADSSSPSSEGLLVDSQGSLRA